MHLNTFAQNYTHFQTITHTYMHGYKYGHDTYRQICTHLHGSLELLRFIMSTQTYTQT